MPLDLADAVFDGDRAHAGMDSPVGICHGVAKPRRETVTIVGEKLSSVGQGQHRAATAAIKSIAALLADGIRGDVSALPHPVHLLVPLDRTLIRDVANSSAGFTCALPASIDVPYGVEDIHAQMCPAIGGLEHCEGVTSLREHLLHLGADSLVGPSDDTGMRVRLPHFSQRLREPP